MSMLCLPQRRCCRQKCMRTFGFAVSSSADEATTNKSAVHRAACTARTGAATQTDSRPAPPRPLARRASFPPCRRGFDCCRSRTPATGDNGRGQLGISGQSVVFQPQSISAVGRWAALSVSDAHAMVRTTLAPRARPTTRQPHQQPPPHASAPRHDAARARECAVPTRAWPRGLQGLSCDGGQLYTWGANGKGQLGHGDKCPGAIDAPVQVQALADSEVK